MEFDFKKNTKTNLMNLQKDVSSLIKYKKDSYHNRSNKINRNSFESEDWRWGIQILENVKQFPE